MEVFIQYYEASRSVEITEGQALVIGRDKEAVDLHFPHPALSRRHAVLTFENGYLFIEDLHSSNGTYVNSNRLKPDNKKKLTSKDVIRLTPSSELVLSLTSGKNLKKSVPIVDLKALLGTKGSIVVGRSAECDVILEDLVVSRKHAKVFWLNGHVFIEDLQSANGVFINDSKINAPHKLCEDDCIQIGICRFSWSQEASQEIIEDVALEAVNIEKKFDNGIIGLQASNLKINQGEFVALMGPSGCGKSTLLKALNGYSPPTSGSIGILGLDMHRHFGLLKHVIGYVPQENIIHDQLTVDGCMYYAAKLRMPADATEQEIKTRIEDVLSSLNIGELELRTTRISNLSGGQRKRVCIAVELLSRPKLLFLDEPTSPLDPETIEEFLRCLSALCQKGTTVIMVTHKPEDLNYINRIVFMGIHGHITYDGERLELLKHFEAKSIIEVYGIMSRKMDVLNWYEKMPKNSFNISDNFSVNIHDNDVNNIRQFWWLTRRYISIKFGNYKNIILLLIQPIFISILIGLTFDALVSFDPTTSKKIGNLGILFLLAISAIWFGVSSSAKEIVGEIDVAKREFMINVRLGTYLGSKQVVLMVISALQLFVFQCVIFGLFPELSNFWLLYLVLLMIGCVAVHFGLVLSVFAKSTEEVMSMLPIALMPQIILAGVLQPFTSNTTLYLSYLTIGRWGTELVARVQDFGRGKVLFGQQLDRLFYSGGLSGLSTDSKELNFLFLTVLLAVMYVMIYLKMRHEYFKRIEN